MIMRTGVHSLSLTTQLIDLQKTNFNKSTCMSNMSTSSETPSHRDLLIQAKQQQKQDLAESARLSETLAKTVNAIVRANLVANNSNCPPLLDKITTVHELDKEIDRQLRKDVSVNYGKLVVAKERLRKEIAKVDRALHKEKEFKVDKLQRWAEQLDQELRILESTLELIKSQR